MGLLAMIALGVLAGWLAFMAVRSREGLTADVILGVVGAISGGLVMEYLGQSGVTGFNLYSLFMAGIGAIVLIAVGKMFAGGRPVS